MPSWFHPGLLITVTTPRGHRYVWFDDRFTYARAVDEPTQARIMRLQWARLTAVLVIAGMVLTGLALALLSGAAAEVNPLVYAVAFAVPAGLLSAVFARAQRRHAERGELLVLPPEAVARLQAARAQSPFGTGKQRDVACKVAAELVFRRM